MSNTFVTVFVHLS